MKRREFFEKAGMGSAALVSLPVLGGASKTRKGSESGAQDEHGHDGSHEVMNGPLSSVEVSFGQWDLATPLDRFPNKADRTRNNHQLIPGVARVKAGGSVKFIIAGFHHVLIYEDGVMPADIDITKLTTVTVPPGPPLINDPIKRLYRGLDPSTMPLLAGTPPVTIQDRVEAVRFPNPGTFLVICGVLPHFVDAAGNFVMFGFVNVLK